MLAQASPPIPDYVAGLLGVFFAALVYVVVDTYPVVKSMKAALRTWSFWLYWFVYGILDLIACSVLQHSAGDKIAGAVGQQASGLTVIVLGTIGTIAILQSFSLKIADYKIVDVSKLTESFRGKVLEDVARNFGNFERLRQLRLIDRLADKFAKDPRRLREAYSDLMTSGKRTQADVNKELERLEQDAKDGHRDLARILAQRIAQIDQLLAQQLLIS